MKKILCIIVGMLLSFTFGSKGKATGNYWK